MAKSNQAERTPVQCSKQHVVQGEAQIGIDVLLLVFNAPARTEQLIAVKSWAKEIVFHLVLYLGKSSMHHGTSLSMHLLKVLWRALLLWQLDLDMFF